MYLCTQVKNGEGRVPEGQREEKRVINVYWKKNTSFATHKRGQMQMLEIASVTGRFLSCAG